MPSRPKSGSQLQRSGSVPPNAECVSNSASTIHHPHRTAHHTKSTSSEVDLSISAPFGGTSHHFHQSRQVKPHRNSWKNRANRWQWLWNRKDGSKEDANLGGGSSSRDSSASSTKSKSAYISCPDIPNETVLSRSTSPHQSLKASFGALFNRHGSNSYHLRNTSPSGSAKKSEDNNISSIRKLQESSVMHSGEQISQENETQILR